MGKLAKVALNQHGDWLPLDHAYWAHEAEAVRLTYQLKALGWEFWS